MLLLTWWVNLDLHQLITGRRLCRPMKVGQIQEGIRWTEFDLVDLDLVGTAANKPLLFQLHLLLILPTTCHIPYPTWPLHGLI